MRPRRTVVALALVWLAAAAPASAPAFDAGAAWTEFETTLRDGYGYFERPGIDGPAIIAAFRERARAAPDRAAFIDVLQLAARNFADSHLIVGPLGPEDHAVIPTSSDLYASCARDRCTVRDVRGASAAAAAKIAPGATIVAIDGRAPAAAVALLLGRPVADLTPAQVDFGINTALAGVRGQPRTLVLDEGGRTRRVGLAPTRVHAQAIDSGPPLTVTRRGDAAIIRIENSLGDYALITAFRAALAQAMDARTLVIDLRNTPSGGNTTVARGIMGHFTDRERPYQMHIIPYDARKYGAPRKFVEYLVPTAPRYRGRVVVLAGRWTGSMGEGMTIGFDAIGVTTVGSPMGDLLGALYNTTLAGSGAKVDYGSEQLLHVDGMPREEFTPRRRVEPADYGDAALVRALAR